MNAEPLTPVRPRDAASVVLVRGRGDAAEVLMGRRRSKAAFLPDIYVFPGGRVDTADIAAGRSLPVPTDLIDRLTRRCRTRSAMALAIAALRETYEETGLLLADPELEPLDHTHAASPLWQAYAEAMAAPALGRLRYVARAITPTSSPRRFNTRFFMIDADYARGTLLTESELLDLHWVRLTDAKAKLNVVDVTEFVLGTVRRHLVGEADDKVPLWHYINDVAHTIYE
ncbi:MAG: NUDIX domain-containing protein [Alphaproteobacteria bacterium]|nr:NUDIX domain-containing protein [Alphaproteobacteria bacterium]